MTRTGICGFEAKDNTTAPSAHAVDGVIVGTGVTIDTTIVRSGLCALKVVAPSGSAGYYNLATFAQFANYNRCYVRVTSAATGARVLFGDSTSGILLNTDGSLVLKMGGSTIGTTTTKLTDTARWYRVEWRLVNGSSVPVLLIDGNTEITGSPSAWSMSSICGASDSAANTYTAYFDDVAIDSAAFPGDGNVVLLLPTGDNSNTNWRCGDSTTSNLWQGVDNTPPAGLASANETATSNIESASSTGTANYIATMKTYTAAGVPSGATINAIVQVVVQGEDITTNTKNGSYELTSNPVVGATSFTFGNDGGAHVAYTDAGSLWQVVSLFTSAPSVTLGNAPLMKVVKTDTGTRVGCVCFMGIYVDYTPAGGTTYTDAGSAVSPAVASGGKDLFVAVEAGGAVTPAKTSGVDQFITTDLGGGVTPATASGVDQFVPTEQGGAVSPAVASGAQQHIVQKLGGTVAPAVASGADQFAPSEQGSAVSPATASGVDQFIPTEIGSGTAPAVASGASQKIASGGAIYTAAGSGVSPAVVSGADQFMAAELGGSAAPAIASGADQFITSDLGGAVTPALAGGIDQFIATELGGATSPAIASGVDQFITVELGGAVSPAIASGVDQFSPAEQGGAVSPVTASGADQFVTAELGSGTTPAVASGASQLIAASGTTYTEAGSAVTPVVASGVDQFVPSETGGAVTPLVAGGLDIFIPSESGGAVAPVIASGASQVTATGGVTYIKAGDGLLTSVAGGADQFITSDLGGAVAPAVVSGDAGAHGGMGSWVPFAGLYDDGSVKVSRGEKLGLPAHEQFRRAVLAGQDAARRAMEADEAQVVELLLMLD